MASRSSDSRGSRRTSRRSTRSGRGTPIGELLIKVGAVSTEQLTRALKTQEQQGGGLLGQILTGMGACTYVDIVEALNKQFRITGVDLSQVSIPPEATVLVPREDCEANKLVPFELLGNLLCVAMANVLQRKAINEIQETTELKVKAFSSSWPEVRDAIEHWYTAHAGAPVSEASDGALPGVDPISLDEPAAAPAPAASEPGGEEGGPFAGDPSTWKRDQGRTSAKADLKRQLMSQSGVNRAVDVPVPQAEPADPGMADPSSYQFAGSEERTLILSASEVMRMAELESIDEEPPAAAGEADDDPGDTYEAPMYFGGDDQLPSPDEFTDVQFADLTEWLDRAPAEADAERLRQGEVPPGFVVERELHQALGRLLTAQVVARSRDELIQMRNAAADAEAAIADLDFDEEPEEIAAAPAPEEPPSETFDDTFVPLIGDVSGPVAAVAISDAEFEQLVGPNAEADPAQEWEELVLHGGPITAQPA